MWLKWESGHIGHKIKKRGKWSFKAGEKAEVKNNICPQRVVWLTALMKFLWWKGKNIFSEHQEFLYAGQLYTEHLDINPSEEKQI